MIRGLYNILKHETQVFNFVYRPLIILYKYNIDLLSYFITNAPISIGDILFVPCMER